MVKQTSDRTNPLRGSVVQNPRAFQWSLCDSDFAVYVNKKAFRCCAISLTFTHDVSTQKWKTHLLFVDDESSFSTTRWIAVYKQPMIQLQLRNGVIDQKGHWPLQKSNPKIHKNFIKHQKISKPGCSLIFQLHIPTSKLTACVLNLAKDRLPQRENFHIIVR